MRTSKNVLYENPYCVTGAVKPTGSEQTPKGKCTDRIIGTRKGAEILRMEDRIGTVEAGKLADIIICRGDPL